MLTVLTGRHLDVSPPRVASHARLAFPGWSSVRPRLPALPD